MLHYGQASLVCLVAFLFAYGCSVREDLVPGKYRLNNVGTNLITLDIRSDHTFVQRAQLTGKSELVVTSVWRFNRMPDTRNRPSTGKANFDPYSAGTIYLRNAYSFENCPNCEARRYESVALPIERFSRLVILVEDPDHGVGYEKQ
jgi:hypothetical protein